MSKGALTWKIFLGIAANDLGDSIAQLLMKKGLGHSSFLAGLGIAVYALNFFVWIAILSRMDLSLALPIGSTTYVVIPFAAMFFFHETIAPQRWIGILLIAAGIHCISRSASAKSQPQVAPR